MVPQKRDDGASLGYGDDLLHDASAVRATVNVIADEDERILRRRLDCLDERCQGFGAAVNIPDGDDALGHSDVSSCRS